MKSTPGHWPLLLALCLTLLVPVHAARGGGDDPGAEVAAPGLSARASQLAADVREFAGAPGLSRSKKEKRIATAVRVAVVAATSYRQNPREILGAALELAAAAARAAPAYAEVIVNAAALAPSVAAVEGAAGQIRTEAMAAAKGQRTHPSRSVAARPRTEAPPARRPRPSDDEEPAPRVRHPAADNADQEPAPRRTSRPRAVAADERDDGTVEEEVLRSRRTRRMQEENAGIHATVDLGVKHDDNIYLANTKKVSATILSATPGVAASWGQQSLAHGALGYSETFNRYVHKTDLNVSLGNGSASFGYDNGMVNVGLAGSYQQIYQSNADVLASGRSTLIKTTLTGGSANVETQLGSKTSLAAGGNLSDTKYDLAGFIGNRNTTLPLNFYYKVTPKVDLSLGYSYGSQVPTGGGASSKDNYFNLGARGNFTAKLAGNFTVGYQTRRVGANPAEHLVAYTGAFDYALTAKTSSTLTVIRNFTASSLGASTKTGAYRLGLKSDLSPQWQLGTSVGYLDASYGAAVFRTTGTAPAQRTDHSWEGAFNATYIFTEWLTTSLSYNLRHNRSTIPGLDFASNVFSLSASFRY